MPYQPVELTATIGCAAARAGRPPAARRCRRNPTRRPPLDGLRLVGTSAGVRITSAGVDLGTVPLPPGAVHARARVRRPRPPSSPWTARRCSARTGDVRPDVAGIFTDASAHGDTLALSLTADTRFATTPSPLKIALAVAGPRGAGRAVRAAPVGGPGAAAGAAAAARLVAPRPVDAVVAALLGVWWVIGSGTVDDGYIAGIVRGRGDNGFVGNVYRWLNAPEAPFGWFYEPYHWWSTISAATPWMRLPSTLLGLLCWFLVSRLLLPRLGRVGRLRGTPWVAALAFGTWWVPLDLGLRPEPWVAVGTVLAFLAVERAVATRRVLPLAAALTVAGATAAVTPGGLMAAAPVLAAAVPLLRGLRARTDLHLRGALRAAPLVAALVAAGASALLLMAADQGPAALAEAVRVRGRIGGGLPWYEEFERYALLLTPGDVQGAIGRRAAVLGHPAGRRRPRLGAGRAGALRRRRGPDPPAARDARAVGRRDDDQPDEVDAALRRPDRARHGGAHPGARRLRPPRPRALRDPATARRRRIAGLAGATVVCGLVLAGQNMWPFVSGWYTPTFSTVPPQVRTVPGGDDRAGGGRGGRHRAAGVVGVAASASALRGRAHPRDGTQHRVPARPRPSSSCSSPCWGCRC